MRTLIVALLLAASATAVAARKDKPAPPRRAPEIHALLVNGGGGPAKNYQSHLVNLRDVTTLLRARGVPADNISVFASDGANPAPDLVVADGGPRGDEWLLQATALWPLISAKTRLVNSTLDGYRLLPADHDALRAWFERARKELIPGDTLLLYVTDHGERNPADLDNNFISLWNEDLSVLDLKALLGRLPPGVRVVLWMSQCFSGSFARAMYALGGGAPNGQTCGYFSTTASRLAYGCYADVGQREGLGHSHEMVSALQQTNRLAGAHAITMVADDTPDVPMSTSDRYLADLLDERRRRDPEVTIPMPLADLVDAWLETAWLDKAAYEPEIRLLDAIGERFGMASPRFMRALDEQRARLENLAKELDTYKDRWSQALDSARQENLAGFMDGSSAWKAELAPEAVKALADAEREQLRARLAVELGKVTRADAEAWPRLSALRDKEAQSREMYYRTEVRLAAILRMQAVLQRIAGRAMLTEEGTSEERAAFGRLLECEGLTLGGDQMVASAEPAEHAPFPSFEADSDAILGVLPSWLGVQYRQVPENLRERAELPGGANVVLNVFPGSPASGAGLQVGDILLGPAGRHFRHSRELGQWVMLAPRGTPLPIEVRRGDERVVASLTLAPYPMKWPELPGPPKVGKPAPPLKLLSFRGDLPPIGKGREVVLFYWATWCGPCKAAVPDLLEYGRAHDAVVIAITDESSEVLAPFFEKWKEPFPTVVAIDAMRLSFSTYAVSGTPTFVHIGADGRIRAHHVGFTPSRGLGLDPS